MNLSEEQIQLIFAFIEKKLVRYFDLQIELVDHLAERIEEEMTANPETTFETALQKVYAGFGIFGFAKIVQEKENELLKQNRSIWLNELLSFIKFPKIAFTACLFIVAYRLPTFIPEHIVTTGTYALFIMYFLISQLYIFKIAHTKKTKKLLLLRAFPAVISSAVPLMEYSIFFAKKPDALWFSISVVLSVILQWTTTEVYKKIASKSKRLYPDAFA